MSTTCTDMVSQDNDNLPPEHAVQLQAHDDGHSLYERDESA